MSGQDSIVINSLEQALSTDINNIQSIAARTLASALQQLNVLRVGAADQAFPAESPRNVVLGGLVATPSGNDVSMSAGVLLQYSATLSPVPGTLDSAYRVGRLAAATTVTLPSPGSDTYYLLEAQVTSAVADSQVRNIYNPGTDTYTPTLVTTQIDKGVSFQLVSGTSTNYPAASGGDWVPIAGIFRPAGGGAVSVIQLADLRPLVQFVEGGSGRATRGSRSGHAETDGSLYGMQVEFEGTINGVPAFIRTPSNAGVLLDAGIADPDASPVPLNNYENTYLYLAPCLDTMPRGQVIDNFAWGTSTTTPTQNDQRGVLVWSNVPPANQGEMTNGAQLRLPSPFSNYTVAAGKAVCVGALKKTTDPAAVYEMQWSGDLATYANVDDTFLYFYSNIAFAGTQQALYNAYSDRPIPPVTAKSSLCEFFGSLHSVASLYRVYVQNHSGTGAGPFICEMTSSDNDNLAEKNVIVPMQKDATGMYLRLSGAGTIVLSARLQGWIE